MLACTPLVVVNTTLFPFTFPKGVFVYALATVVALAAWGNWLTTGWQNRARSLVVPAVWLLLAALAVSAWRGADPYSSFWGNFERMNGIVFFAYWTVLVTALVGQLRSERQWRMVLIAQFAAAVAVAFFVVMAVLGVDLYINMNEGRVGGTLGNAAYLATYGLLNGILAGYAALRYERLRAWGWAVVGMNLLMIVISATRGPLLAIGLAVVAYLAWVAMKPAAPERPWRRWAVGALVAIVALSSTVFALRDTAAVRAVPVVERIVTMNLTEGTLYNRWRVWQYALEAWQKRPWLGWGLENVSVAFNTVYNSDLNEEWFDRTHNAFLDMLVMGGVVGLAAYLVVMMAIAVRIVQLYRQGGTNQAVGKWLGLGFAAYLLQNMVLFDTVTSYVLLAFFAALVESIHARNRSDYTAVRTAPRLKPAVAHGIVLVAAVAGGVALYYTAVLPVRANNAAVAGIVAMKEGEVEAAKSHFSQALAYKSYGTDEILYRMGDIIAGMVEQHEDYTYLDFALEQFAGNVDGTELRHVYQLATFYSAKARTASDPALQQEYVQKYRALIEENLQRYPGRHLLHSHRGRAALLANDAPTAIAAFRKAAELKDNGDQWWNLYVVYKNIGDEEGARDVIERLVTGTRYRLPQEQWQALAVRYLEREEWDVSRRILERALKDYEVGIFHLLLAKAYDQLGDATAAEQHLQRAMELDKTIRKQIKTLRNTSN